MSVTSFELYHFVAPFKQEQAASRMQACILYLGKASLEKSEFQHQD